MAGMRERKRIGRQIATRQSEQGGAGSACPRRQFRHGRLAGEVRSPHRQPAFSATLHLILSGLAVLGMLACVGALAGTMADNYTAFEAARKLQEEGHEQEAFLKYLAIPGGEYAAATLARGDSKTYLALLRKSPGALESPRALLVEADLLLATGQKEEAIKRSQTLAAAAPKNNWGTDQAGYYPVEPLQNSNPESAWLGSGRSQLNPPFTYGPGSHRDNWLLRRLLALDLTDDAAREFGRIWEVHSTNTQLYIEVLAAYDGQNQINGEEKRLVRPAGFNSLGLQFALDYAFFLKRSGQSNQALAILLEPIRQMDMDRNPNFVRREPLPASMSSLPVRRENAASFRFGFGPGMAGVSRKEYLRLAYGEFKAAGQESALLEGLQKQLNADDNRARRLLAQVRLHQGQTETALELELDYIARGDFDALTSAYRRGLIYEEYHKNSEAAAEFEKVLAMKPGPMRLPDPEEQIRERQQSQVAQAFSPAQLNGLASLLEPLQVMDRLVRLYSALGRADKAMDLQLAQFEKDERRLESLEAIEQMAQRFEGAGQAARFSEWARKELATAKTPLARANLAWQQQDYATALTNAIAAAPSGYYGWLTWRERFARLGRNQEREFIQAFVDAHPQDAVARLTLLDMEDRLEGAEAIAALEALLTTDAGEAFPRGKGVSNRTHFRNYLDLAYRLMRLYESNDQLNKLRALGLRIARDEKPFDKYDQNLYWSLGETSMEELGNACLALAIQYAQDNSYQQQLSLALKNSRWAGAGAQLERRAGGRKPGTPGEGPGLTNSEAARPALGWANVSDKIEIFASHRAVTCLACDDKFVYGGMSWGLTVYDLKGGPLARLALGCAVQTMVVTQQDLWIGTAAGLFRVRGSQPLSTGRTPNWSWSVARHPVGNVTALALDGETLWIGLNGEIKTLNQRTLELRSFSPEDLKLQYVGNFSRIVPDGDFVWTDGGCGLLRYDRASDTWSAPRNPGPRDPPHLMGILDGQVWVDVYLDNELRHRPARVDRQTLMLTPATLGGNLPVSQRLINESFAYAGKDNGRLVFRGGWGWFMFDEAANQIRSLPEDYSNGKQRISDPVADGLPRTGWDVAQATAGWPDGLRAGYRASVWPDAWPEGAVWAVVFDNARQKEWLCTGAGLAVRQRGQRVFEQYGFAEGLNYGPMMDGVELGGRLYFATGWEDARGGLSVYDPQTAVFTTFFRSDGMDSDKVIGLSAKDGQLELRYGVEFLRGNGPGDRNYRACPVALFDPVTRRFRSTGQPELLTQSEANARTEDDANLRKPQPNVPAMPYLGGGVFKRYEHEGKTWFCGERGLVVLPGPDAGLVFTPLSVKVIPNLDQLLREEAARANIPRPISVEMLQTMATSTNRYVRADALAAAMDPVLQGQTGFLPILVACVHDPYVNARSTAVWLLTRLPGQVSSDALRQALADPDDGIRIVAALALAKRNQRPPLAHFQETLSGREFGNYPFGASSSVGIQADKLHAYEALASGADREAFELFMKYPLEPSGYSEYPQVLAALGAALVAHPDAVEPLLHAHDTPPRSWQGQVQFAQAVFKNAGKGLLPVLHPALSSPDRVVRSNAARGCGGIADPSSIAPLLSALDLESGLARASIVWALGELKAAQAIPRLIDLYTDARNAEHNRRASAGFLAAQAAAANQAQYVALRNLDAIASDWDELKLAATVRPADPRQDETLLTAGLVLEAVRKMGPAAQDFYRALAGAKEASDRAEAAVGLAEGTAADRDKNLAILNNLRADGDAGVQVRALVSLLILGQREPESILRQRLISGSDSEQGQVLEQLARVPGPQLQFARQEIEAIAGNDRRARFLRNYAAPLVPKLRANK
jgi:HEAT repeat protein